MKPVVNVPDLLDRLEANRAKHRTVFEAALEGWKAQAQAQVDAMAKELSAGRYPELRLNLPLPTDHTRDYDRAIVAVHMHTLPTIELSETDMAHFIQDDWEWKRQWLRMSSSYAAGSVREMYGDDDGELEF